MTANLARDWPYPRLVAHRGAGKLAPENTLTAMRVGHAHGYRMVEFDVKLAADSVAFLLHDATLERTTGGRGRADALHWGELSRLDAGAWHSAEYAGEPLPTLAAIARWARAHGVACNIEIKPTPGRERETGAAVAIDAATLWRDAEVPPLLSSFSEEALDGRARGGAGAAAGAADGSAGRRLAGPAGAPRMRGARRQPQGARPPRSSRVARAAGYRVLCYTPNDAERIADAGRLGCRRHHHRRRRSHRRRFAAARRCRCRRPEASSRPRRAGHRVQARCAAGRAIARSSIGRLMSPATMPSAIEIHQTTS